MDDCNNTFQTIDHLVQELDLKTIEEGGQTYQKLNNKFSQKVKPDVILEINQNNLKILNNQEPLIPDIPKHNIFESLIKNRTKSISRTDSNSQQHNLQNYANAGNQVNSSVIKGNFNLNIPIQNVNHSAAILQQLGRIGSSKDLKLNFSRRDTLQTPKNKKKLAILDVSDRGNKNTLKGFLKLKNGIENNEFNQKIPLNIKFKEIENKSAKVNNIEYVQVINKKNIENKLNENLETHVKLLENS